MNLLNTLPKTKVIASGFLKDIYTPLDLSVNNVELAKIDCTNLEAFEKYLNSVYQMNNANIAYGGYTEKRNLYRKSAVFKQTTEKERDTHIGLDIWIKENTPILAAYDGEIHSFKNNDSHGNYGPTIILKHNINGFVFHTLYGHLSVESLVGLSIGKKVSQGEIIAALGTPEVNGNYAPHLHFQIIIDMENNFGDYPGVCHEEDLKFYSNNCPNPEEILIF